MTIDHTQQSAAAAKAAGKPTHPVRRESSEDRRAAIAGAARELIVEKGFEGLRTREIAERVGINIATLHYHVPTKEALIELVAESAKAEFLAQDSAHPRDGMTPCERLRQEIADFGELMVTRRDLLQFMAELIERGKRDAHAAGIVTDMLSHWIGAVHEIMTAGRDSGHLRSDLDPAAAAPLFIGALMGAAKISKFLPVDRKALLQELERAFVNPLVTDRK